MRALLDLMRKNEARVQTVAFQCQILLVNARDHLKILDPEVGEEELCKAVAVELAKVSR